MAASTATDHYHMPELSSAGRREARVELKLNDLLRDSIDNAKRLALENEVEVLALSQRLRVVEDTFFRLRKEQDAEGLSQQPSLRATHDGSFQLRKELGEAILSLRKPLHAVEDRSFQLREEQDYVQSLQTQLSERLLINGVSSHPAPEPRREADFRSGVGTGPGVGGGAGGGGLGGPVGVAGIGPGLGVAEFKHPADVDRAPSNDDALGQPSTPYNHAMPEPRSERVVRSYGRGRGGRRGRGAHAAEIRRWSLDDYGRDNSARPIESRASREEPQPDHTFDPPSPARSTPSSRASEEPTGPRSLRNAAGAGAQPIRARIGSPTVALYNEIDEAIRMLPPAVKEGFPEAPMTFPLAFLQNKVGGNKGTFAKVSGTRNQIISCHQVIRVKNELFAPQMGCHGAVVVIDGLENRYEANVDSPLFRKHGDGWEYEGEYRTGKTVVVQPEVWEKWDRDKQMHIVTKISKMQPNPKFTFLSKRGLVNREREVSSIGESEILEYFRRRSTPNLRMVYVILQCIRYDRRTYDTLVEAHDRETSRTNKPTSTRFHESPHLHQFSVNSKRDSSHLAPLGPAHHLESSTGFGPDHAASGSMHTTPTQSEHKRRRVDMDSSTPNRVVSSGGIPPDLNGGAIGSGIHLSATPDVPTASSIAVNANDDGNGTTERNGKATEEPEPANDGITTNKARESTSPPLPSDSDDAFEPGDNDLSYNNDDGNNEFRF